MTERGSRIDDIEALRAIAVAFTIFGHLRRLLPWAGNLTYTTDPYGAWWAGVDLFFCISGFVIARDLLQRLQDAENAHHFWKSTIAFWVKRIFRIWPTSWLWITVILLASIVLRKTGTFAPFHQTLQDFTAVAVQMQNFHAWRCAASNQLMQCDAAAPWWSLSLEEQFYIALPLTILLFRKRLHWVFLTLVAVQFFVPRTPGAFLYYIRTDAISLGVLLAMFQSTALWRKIDPVFMRQKKYAIPVLSVCLLLLFTLARGQTTIDVMPNATGMIAVVSVVLVCIASYNQNYIARGGLVRKALLWLGSRSYALYLIHWPMMDFTHALWRFIEPFATQFGSNYSLRYALVWGILTVVFSELNYRFVERPLRQRGKQIAQRIEGEPPASVRLQRVGSSSS
ncbi:MAG: acyltransferase [Paraburkholderia sp.]|uniref:acyltransferase family protein n=1 Tax=Paraburkholderia sp. TaxID=1926495 RepID=UPI003C594C66